jgi:hypothetical protein
MGSSGCSRRFNRVILGRCDAVLGGGPPRRGAPGTYRKVSAKSVREGSSSSLLYGQGLWRQATRSVAGLKIERVGPRSAEEIRAVPAVCPLEKARGSNHLSSTNPQVRGGPARPPHARPGQPVRARDRPPGPPRTAAHLRHRTPPSRVRSPSPRSTRSSPLSTGPPRSGPATPR